MFHRWRQALAFGVACLFCSLMSCSQSKRCARGVFGDPPFVRLSVSPEPVDGVLPCAWETVPSDGVQLRIRFVETTCVQGAHGRLECATRARGITEGTQVCAVALGFRMPEFTIGLTVDQVVMVQTRTNTLNPEKDVIPTGIVRDQEGALLLGWAWGTRPSEFDKDLFQGMEISTEPPFCTSTESFSPVAVRFVSGPSECVVRDTSDAACTLWDRPFVVRVFDAYQQTSGPSPYVTFTIARPDLLSAGVLR